MGGKVENIMGKNRGQQENGCQSNEGKSDGITRSYFHESE
jgi:hypothetical protein